jgi:hypothetical protein
VNGYGTVSMVEVMTKRIPAFRPNVVVFVAHPEDASRTINVLGKSIGSGVAPGYPYLRSLIEQRGLTPGSPRAAVERQLSGDWQSIVGWTYRQVADEARKEGIIPVWVYVPGVLHTGMDDRDHALIRMAREANFAKVIVLDPYKAQQKSELVVAPWDHHPNAKGHRLVAEALYGALTKADTWQALFGANAQAAPSETAFRRRRN